MIAYFDFSLPSKELKVTKKYKTLEIIAVEARLGNNEVILHGICWAPKQSEYRIRFITFQANHENHGSTSVPENFRLQRNILLWNNINKANSSWNNCLL